MNSLENIFVFFISHKLWDLSWILFVGNNLLLNVTVEIKNNEDLFSHLLLELWIN